MGKNWEEQKTVVRGTFWGLLGGLLIRLVSFAYTVILARFFIPDDVGAFYLALSVTYIASLFSDLGMNATFSRYVPYFIGAGKKEKAFALLKAAYNFSGALSVIIAIMLFFFSGQIAVSFKMPQLEPMVQIMSLFIVLNAFFSLNTSFLSGIKKIKENALSNNIQNLVKLGLTIGMFYIFGPAAFVIALSFVLSYVIAVAFSFWYLGKGISQAGIRNVPVSLREQYGLLVETMPLGITLALVGGLMTLSGYVDRLMLGYMLPSESAAAQIAIYSMAFGLATIISSFPLAILGIFTPVITELYGKQKIKEMIEISKTTLRWVIFLTVPITAVMIAFSAELLQMFYGSYYAAGSTVVVVFSIGLFLSFLSFVHRTILAAMRIVKIELYGAIASILLNIVLNFLLIPPYGIDGAIVATSISLVVVSAFLVYYTKKLSGFGFPSEAYLPIFGGVLALAVLLAIHGGVVQMLNSMPHFDLFEEQLFDTLLQKSIKLAVLGLLSVLSCAIYFVFLLLSKSFAKEDMDVMSGAMRRAGIPKPAIEMIEKVLGRFVA